MTYTKRFLGTALAACIATAGITVAPDARANSKLTLSNSGVLSAAAGSVVLVAGSVAMSATSTKEFLQESGLLALPKASVQLSVTALRPLGEMSVVVLQSAGASASYGFALSSKVVGDLGLAVGTTIEAVSVGVGHVLVAGGKLIGFVPQPGHKDLLFSKQVRP